MPEPGENTTRPRARIVLLGMRCAFTAPVLEALLDAPGVDLRAVVLPEAPASPLAASRDPIADLVREGGIPLHEVGSRGGLDASDFRTAMDAIAPDLVVIACFPWRVPGWLRSLPAGGCLNVHPSLLPDGRGAEPVFWAFRWGLEETGVTLHLVDAGFDTGPVVAQQRFAIPDSATIGSLERDLARLGASLLIDRLPALFDGTVVPSPQGQGRARHAPIPGPDDLIVPTSWSARHAARFIRAVAPIYGPVPVLIHATGQRLAVHEVIGMEDEATMPEPVRLTGTEAQIRFTPGVLTCRLHTPSQPINVRG